jgi:hypothetical protein
MKKKIEWNKVTWYSKTLAAVIFIILPLVAFYYGVQLGIIINSVPPQIVAINYVSKGEGAAQSYANPDYQFVVEYPAGWRVSESIDPYTLAAISPRDGGLSVKLFLEKNNFKDIAALKKAKDVNLGPNARYEVRHFPDFDALIYTGIPQTGINFAAMFITLNKSYILGIAGPDIKTTLDIFNSFKKI